jgi:DNA-directed RNA polymerase specialized sigma24 family protein
LFEEHSARLLSAVSAAVRTSPVNIDDACAFAWLQLLRYQPDHQVTFGWLCKTAIREAIKLDRRARRLVELDRLGEHPANDLGHELDRRLELLAAIQTIDEARLRPRERRLVALRGLGYSRRQMSELTGDSFRTLDRQLGRARRKLALARSGTWG